MLKDVQSASKLMAENRQMREALEKIGAQQRKTLERFRMNGIVFDGPFDADPKNWENVAFSIYTDLCEVDLWAKQALGDRPICTCSEVEGQFCTDKCPRMGGTGR